MNRFASVGLTFISALISTLASIQFASAAIVSVHTQRSSFASAIGGSPRVETFNQITEEIPFHTVPLDVGPFMISMTGLPSTAPQFNRIDVPPITFSSFNIDGSTVASVQTTKSQELVITFDRNILAFGASFGELNEYFVQTQIVIENEVFTPAATTCCPWRFFGLVSDTPFRTVRLVALPDDSLVDGYSIDNVVYAHRLNVPEPASVALCASVAAWGCAIRLVRRQSRRSGTPGA
jgi:hypothetical protein